MSFLRPSLTKDRIASNRFLPQSDWALPTPTRDPIIYDQTPPNSRTVRVGNLAFAVDESDIWDLFPGLDMLVLPTSILVLLILVAKADRSQRLHNNTSRPH